jgi:hypothetical protein
MSSPKRPESPGGTVKKTDTLGTMDEPTKLNSVPGFMDEVTRIVDHKAERRLCRKFDYRLLPVLAVMCTSISGQITQARLIRNRLVQCFG